MSYFSFNICGDISFSAASNVVTTSYESNIYPAIAPVAANFNAAF